MLPYSLKFSRLKIFAGQRTAAKICPTKFQIHRRCKAWLEAINHETFILKNLILSRICKTAKYLPLKNFRLYSINFIRTDVLQIKPHHGTMHISTGSPIFIFQYATLKQSS